MPKLSSKYFEDGGRKGNRKRDCTECLLLTLTPHIDYTFSGLPSRTKHGDLSCWHLKRDWMISLHCTINTHPRKKKKKTQQKLYSRFLLWALSYKRLQFPPCPDHSCTEISPPLVLSGFQPASYPLKDGLHDAFVSTSYLPGHGGNNSNVWLRENRANHQWLQDI